MTVMIEAATKIQKNGEKPTSIQRINDHSMGEILRLNQHRQMIKDEKKIQKWKYMFLVCNCCILFLSAMLLVSAFHYHNQWSTYAPFLNPYVEMPFIVIVAIGAIMCGCTLIGYLAAFKSYYVATIMYCMTLISTIQIQIYMTIISVLKHNSAKELISKIFFNGMYEYKDNFQMREKINMIQESLLCCGANQAEDWFETPFNTIPWSCCPLRPSNDTPTCQFGDALYLVDDSCGQRLQMIPEQVLTVLYASTGVIIFVEILTLLVSCKLGKVFKDTNCNEGPE